MTFLEIESVSKTYPNAKRSCLEGLDLEVEEGETVVILGHSGCGKTTLLKIIAGLEDCDSGTVSLNGDVINGIPPYDRPISMVFQKPLLFKNLTVEDNINFSPRIKGTMKKDEMHEEVLRLLELIGMEGCGDRKANQLSGGQEQRVSLARALMTKPKLLLLDEPFSALDAELRISLRQRFKAICKSINQTVIFVTHDQQEAVAIGDRIALMHNGRIIQYDRPNVFYHEPISKESAQFFGWTNAIPAIKDNGIVRCPIGEYACPNSPISDGDVVLMIHPQAASEVDKGGLEGTVKGSAYLGTVSNYTVDVNDVELNIQISSRHMYLVGETIRFDLNRDMMCPVPIGDMPDTRSENNRASVLSRIVSLFRRKGTATEKEKDSE